jgi:hypothetical protein
MTTQDANYHRAYRRRQLKAGRKGVLLRLPVETIDLIDHLQRVRGYSSRSDAAIAIITEGTKRIEIES